MTIRYMIDSRDGKLRIINLEGKEITKEMAQQLIKDLMNNYPSVGCVYIAVKIENDKAIFKIGMTGQELSARLSQIRFDEGDPMISILHVIRCVSMAEARDLEKELHSWFKHNHVRGEWFALTNEQLEWICFHQTPPLMSTAYVKAMKNG
jgi:Meiotically Up-regulated Gene 113 (MUG113) protein